jgi:hypothetical protein
VKNATNDGGPGKFGAANHAPEGARTTSAGRVLRHLFVQLQASNIPIQFSILIFDLLMRPRFG